jgi:hypothetical protein
MSQLPLSFFTSYFGQNVFEITGDPAMHSAWHLWSIASELTVSFDVIADTVLKHPLYYA